MFSTKIQSLSSLVTRKFFHTLINNPTTKPSIAVLIPKQQQQQNEIKLPEKFYSEINNNELLNKIPIIDQLNLEKQQQQKFCLDHQHLSILISLNFLINQNKIECPTVNENQIEKKYADYYKHRDPKRFTHLTWVRHRKMKKHQRIKWRKKNLAMIKRRILERNIAKEKQFRAEILAKIKEAEEFDPREYVKNILFTIDNVPQQETPQQRFERYLDLIRKNRQQTNFVVPKFVKKDE